MVGKIDNPNSLLGIDYLNSLAPWKGSAKFTLSPISRVLRALDFPQRGPKVVHIAGTNGKGSVSLLTASILAAGQRSVGLNTSPHLVEFNERIILNGAPIEYLKLNQLLLDIKQAAADEQVSLSFHEAITAVAYHAFRNLDWAVMEVGLGGKLDASNVIKSPVATAVVSIDYDHQNMLGSTFELISAQKFGIVKRGSICVVGDLPSEALEVGLARTELMRAPTRVYGRDFYAQSCDSVGKTIRFGQIPWYFCDCGNGSITKFNNRLPGVHQLNNAAVSVALAKSLGVSDEQIDRGLLGAFWPARLELIKYQDTEFIIDCAHNPAGIRAAAHSLRDMGIAKARVVFGALATKDWPQMVEQLKAFASEWHIVKPDNSQGVSVNEIREYLSSVGISSFGWEGELAEMRDFLVSNSQVTPVLALGSMYYIGKLRQVLGVIARPYWGGL